MDAEIDTSTFFGIVFSSLMEILGRETADEFIRDTDIPGQDSVDYDQVKGTQLVSELGDWLSGRYDPLSASGVLIRVGRSSLTYLRRLDEEIASLGNIENRLKPVDRRFNYSLEILGARLQEISGFQINIYQEGHREYNLKIGKPDVAGSGLFISPYFFFGLMEEFCVWLDSRKDYQISYRDIEKIEKAVINILIREME